MLRTSLALIAAVAVSTSALAQSGAQITTGALPPATHISASGPKADAQKTTERVRAIAAAAGRPDAPAEAKVLALEAEHLGRRAQAALAAYDALSTRGAAHAADAGKYGAHVTQIAAAVARLEERVVRARPAVAQR